MQQTLLQFFQQHAQLAIIISLAVSVVVAVIGVLPSVFITAANILFFGFWPGTALSFAGEALGAAVAFLLYRKGFKKGAQQSLQRFTKVARLVNATGKEAAGLIFSLRLLPFVPSGLVTFAAAVGRIGLPLFVLASSLGKVPALLLEAYAVYAVTKVSVGYQIGLAIIALLIVGFIVLKKKKDD